MTQTFDEYVTEWDGLVAQLEAHKKTMKPIISKEMEMRKAIFAAVSAAMGRTFKEGMNNYSLPDGRVLKVDNPIDRVIDESSIVMARAHYEMLNDKPIDFDDLLRIKYELAKANYNKLTDEGKRVVAQMFTSKQGSISVKLD
jgi:hypothetical protein